MIKTRITDLLNIEYPIIQAGMVWASGYKLALAVSEAGGLGLIGSGSMKPDVLKEHILKIKSKTEKPFGVNIPLLRGDVEELVNTTLESGVKIVFTSAGNPQKFSKLFKSNNVIMAHVVSNIKQALKAQEAGIDIIVAEGFEAGGHNGVDEITTFCLIPQIVDAVQLPVVAAGGISDGRGILAAFALGAEGVQIGTRFAASVESSAHINYKNAIVAAQDSGTDFILRKISPVRTLKNEFSQKIKSAENNGASVEELKEMLGSKREFKGIFEGNIIDGLLDAGQSSGLVKQVLNVNDIFEKFFNEYERAIQKFNKS